MNTSPRNQTLAKGPVVGSSAGAHPRSRRIDIDLLRAVAVLAVIFFHFDVPGFSGGFLGVDIFFVISGYLITTHIKEQLSTSSFSFLFFYMRRIRRLFPALAATLVLTSIAALFILPKTLLDDYSSSLVASGFYVSNIYFWSVADYFDTESIYKPLLHTWSLSVEEQFYVVWPLFVFVAWRWNLRLAVLIAGVLSLLAAVSGQFSQTTVFFHFPFRIFEFAFGALIGGSNIRALPRRAGDALLLAALACIAVPLLTVTELSTMPNVATLALCAGTAIIIGLSHPWANLDNAVTRVFLRIGLVSYSAYLVHWPLVVFYKVLYPGELNAAEIVAMIAVTLILAELMYRFVEQPTARISLAANKPALLASVPLFVALAVAFHVAQPHLYKLLQDDDLSVKRLLDEIPDRRSIRAAVNAEIVARYPGELPADRKKIVVLGDSHAVDFNLALKLSLDLSNYEIKLQSNNCDPLTAGSIGISLEELYQKHSQEMTREKGYCEKHHNTFLQRIVAEHPDVVIFSEAWRAETLPFLAGTIEEVRNATGAEILVLGRIPQFVGNPQVIFAGLETPDQINATAWSRRYKIFDDFDARLSAIAKQTSSLFISKTDIICPEQKCEILIDGSIGYSDTQHMTRAGMVHYGRQLVNKEAFAKALGGPPALF